MASKFIFTVYVALLLSGCATSHKQTIFIEDQPSNHAWWLRTVFNPSGTKIMGIPVHQIEKSWCKANELEQDAFPKVGMGPESENLSSLINNYNSSFSLLLSPKKELQYRVSVGIYETCSKEKGTFALYLAKQDNKKYKVIYHEIISSSPSFAILHPVSNSQFEIWHCFECDDINIYKWSQESKRFILEEREDH